MDVVRNSIRVKSARPHLVYINQVRKEIYHRCLYIQATGLRGLSMGIAIGVQEPLSSYRLVACAPGTHSGTVYHLLRKRSELPTVRSRCRTEGLREGNTPNGGYPRYLPWNEDLGLQYRLSRPSIISDSAQLPASPTAEDR